MGVGSKNTLGFLLLIALCAAFPAQVCSQTSASPSGAPSAGLSEDGGPWLPSAHALGRDALDIARAPFTLSRTQHLIALGAAGLLTSTAATLDEAAYRRTSAHVGPASRATKPFAAPGRWYDRLGPDRTALGTAGLLAVTGFALQRRAMTRTAVRVVEALVYARLVTGLGKSVLNRSRPFSASDPFVADPGEFSSEHAELSMPSGHTARAFAVASVLSHQFERWYVSVPAYGVATSVGLERVRSGDHWLTDVMVGGALGYFIGRAVSPTRSDRDEVTYAPVLSTDRVGLSVRF